MNWFCFLPIETCNLRPRAINGFASACDDAGKEINIANLRASSFEKAVPSPNSAQVVGHNIAKRGDTKIDEIFADRIQI